MIFKFLESLWIYLHLYKAGFFFSSNIHRNSDDHKFWGFFRLNFFNKKFNEFPIYAIIDIDFEDEKFYHIHDDKSIFRTNIKDE